MTQADLTFLWRVAGMSSSGLHIKASPFFMAAGCIICFRDLDAYETEERHLEKHLKVIPRELRMAFESFLATSGRLREDGGVATGAEAVRDFFGFDTMSSEASEKFWSSR